MSSWKQERGFLPLSAALLSSSILRSEAVDAMDMFVDIASTIGAILLSLLMCRSGLILEVQFTFSMGSEIGLINIGFFSRFNFSSKLPRALHYTN